MSQLENSNPVRPLSRFRRVFLLHFKGLMTGRRGSEVDRFNTVEDVEDNLRQAAQVNITLHPSFHFLFMVSIFGTFCGLTVILGDK